MALTELRPLDQMVLTAYLADISTASSAFVVAPFRGKIVKAWSVLHGAITNANAVWTMEINGTAVTGVSVTVAYSGSAAGDVDSGTPTGANTFVEGDAIEFVSDGGSDTTMPASFSVLIERT